MHSEDGEEDLKDLTVARDTGVKLHPDHLCMPSASGAHLFVAGILDMPARVPGLNPRHPFQVKEHRLEAPETTTAQRCLLHQAPPRSRRSPNPEECSKLQDLRGSAVVFRT